jgi:hypothetical protein
MNMFMRVNSSFVTAILTTILITSLYLHGAPVGVSIAGGTAPVAFMLDAFREAFVIQTVVTGVGIALAFYLHDRVLDDWHAVRRQAVQSQTIQESVE